MAGLRYATSCRECKNKFKCEIVGDQSSFYITGNADVHRQAPCPLEIPYQRYPGELTCHGCPILDALFLQLA